MSRRLLAAIVATIVLVALVGPPVAIGATPEIHVTPAQPTPGERVTITGSGFCPGPCSPVSVSVDGSVAATGVAVAPDGTFEVMVGLTPVAGDSTISASQTDGGGAVREATAIVHVVASDPAGPTPTAPLTATVPPATPPPSTPVPPPPSGAVVGPSASNGASAQIQIRPAQPVPGERVTVHGSGFCPAPCSPVTVSVDDSVAASGVTVQMDGTFEATVALTPVAGDSTISATQTETSGAIREAIATVHTVASDQIGLTPSAAPTATPDGDSGSTVSTGLLGALLVLGLATVGAALWWRLRRGRPEPPG